MDHEDDDSFWELALEVAETSIRQHAAAQSNAVHSASRGGPTPTFNAAPALDTRGPGSIGPSSTPNRGQAQPQRAPIIPGLQLPQNEDPFSCVLREKDDEISRITREKDGLIANQRHKIRALESQVEASRNVRAAPAPLSDVTERLTEERSRFSKELTIAETDAARLKEKLSHAEHEISALRERVKRHEMVASAASDAEKNNSSGKSQAVPHPGDDGFPEPGLLGAGTQARGTQLPSADVVESTQVHSLTGGYDMSMRRPPKPRVRRRPGSGGELRSSSFVATQGAPSSQLLSRPLPSAEEMPPPPPPRPRRKREDVETDHEEPDVEPAVHVVWLGRRSDAGEEGTHLSWASNEEGVRALREALFGEGRAERLLQLCSSSKNRDLHQAITQAMASDFDWTNMLKRLSDLCSPGASRVVLEAISSLVEHNRACRVALATDCQYDAVMKKILASLESATSAMNPDVACLCLRIMSCVVSEVFLLDDVDADDNVSVIDKPEYAVLTRRLLEHEAVLLWLQQREPQMCEACSAAAEVASDLIMNIVGTPIEKQDQREADFLEQAVLCFAAVLPVLTVSSEVRSRALCVLDWTSLVAPYFLYERDARVLESLCVFVVEIVHRIRMRVVLEKGAQTAFCELLDMDSFIQTGADDDAVKNEADIIRTAIPQCWDLVVNVRLESPYPGDVGGDDAQIAAVRRAVTIARRLVQKGPAGASLMREVTAATRNVAIAALAFLGWPAGDREAQYPAPKALHEVPTLSVDARIVYDALLRAEVSS